MNQISRDRYSFAAGNVTFYRDGNKSDLEVSYPFHDRRIGLVLRKTIFCLVNVKALLENMKDTKAGVFINNGIS